MYQEIVDVDGLGGAAAGALRVAFEVFDDSGQALNLVEGFADFVLNFVFSGYHLDFFEPHGQGGQGSAQLVGHIGGELVFGGEPPRQGFT